MDPQQLDFEATALGLKPFVLELAQSRLADRREALMAAAPRLWGLYVWVNGRSYIFLDEKGFVCSTENSELIIPLCQYESTLGPGSLRLLLNRPLVDPTIAIEYLTSKVIEKKRIEEIKAKTSTSKSPRRRPLTPTAFKALLEEL